MRCQISPAEPDGDTDDYRRRRVIVANDLRMVGRMDRVIPYVTRDDEPSPVSRQNGGGGNIWRRWRDRI